MKEQKSVGKLPLTQKYLTWGSAFPQSAVQLFKCCGVFRSIPLHQHHVYSCSVLHVCIIVSFLLLLAQISSKSYFFGPVSATHGMLLSLLPFLLRCHALWCVSTGHKACLALMWGTSRCLYMCRYVHIQEKVLLRALYLVLVMPVKSFYRRL